MKVIHVARKPLAGTVARTALAHGTGGLNINRSRLGTKESLDGGAYAEDGSPRPNPEDWRFKREGGAGEFQQPTGRWPANLVLEHSPGCRKVGTEVVKGVDIVRYETDTAKQAYRFYSDREKLGIEATAETQPDTVEDVYECVPDCPCVMLDEQSGVSTNTSHYSYKRSGEFIGQIPSREGQARWRTETGGASRFFKQVGGEPIESP
tara:strand:- start:835 stop:1455 length:621 start_codon:yes stop_codon:yes gene_type:complete